MQALIVGIRAQWLGNPALEAALTGGMYLGVEPAERTQPYCVVTVEETPWWTFDTNFESYVVTFYLYSRAKSPTVILDVYAKLKAAYDEAALAVAGYHVIRFWRTGSSPLQAVDGVWVLVVQYSCELEQTS